jgi:uncharacterized membrane protein YqaE (UPF0057 family)
MLGTEQVNSGSPEVSMSAQEGSRDFMRVVVAWFLPPVGVFMQAGLGAAFWINVLLSLAFWLPGVLHAVWVISTTGEGGVRLSDGEQTFWRLVAAAILPPLGVLMQVGLGAAFWINLVLTAFFWVPGMLHAAWVITHRE